MNKIVKYRNFYGCFLVKREFKNMEKTKQRQQDNYPTNKSSIHKKQYDEFFPLRGFSQSGINETV
jgi:hypothetical protein